MCPPPPPLIHRDCFRPIQRNRVLQAPAVLRWLLGGSARAADAPVPQVPRIIGGVGGVDRFGGDRFDGGGDAVGGVPEHMPQMGAIGGLG